MLCAFLISPVLANTFTTITISGTILELKPKSSFIASPVSGISPLFVNFTDTSSHSPTSWKWEYKSKTGSWKQFSTEQNPSHTFQSGTYDIRLTVKNNIGSDKLIKNNFITVQAQLKPKKPVAIFLVDPVVGKAPLKVTFTDKSQHSPTTYLWYFGDGTTSSVQSPVHTYTERGFYRVTLKVTNSAGVDYTDHTVLVFPKWFWFNWR
jgi:PKD repeat protein